ncbi:hypothetical protein SAMN00120144_0895 [Hymenobacter roseosalivarius DSM 11622]|uniref:PorV/PorQ family protein n=1 Tax=Hymenobacter roseosalivarius DSM 11622 TaxID=645990 RepID=A0A1W1V765_9BACT|nr:hypothetical protein [Hymenobacter roseosalivarius]SMB89277.1 hypothetical protein SAMN00120144_0895 [Hymenobacter roseosalivarius DSM 11622]
MQNGYLSLGVLFLSFTASTVSAGNGPGVRGARAAALGNASVTITDVWAVGNNVAGLGQVSQTSVGFYAENRYLSSAFNTVALVVATPVGSVHSEKPPSRGVVGFEAQRFGNNLYAEQRLGLGYGYRGGQISVGGRVDVLQVSIQGLGSRRVVAASLGGQAELIPNRLVFGGYLYNLNQARLAAYEDERVPTVLKAGLSYRPTSKLMLNVETEKDVEQSADFKAGIEYQMLETLALRAGFASLVEQTTAGVGFKAGRFQIDYAAAWQSALGLSQHVGVSLQWAKK